MPTDEQLNASAQAELKQTTVGWLKQNGQPRYPSGTAPADTHWGKAMALLGQISSFNVAPRDAAIVSLKKTTAKYTATGTHWKAAFAELAKIKNAPAPSEWTQEAVEDAPFTLIVNKEVRYGKGTQWASKILGPGTHRCDNATFGDPAYGIVKVCESRPTTQEPPPPPPPPPPSAFRYGLIGNPTNDTNLARDLGVKIMRTRDKSPNDSVDAMRNYINEYGNRGIDTITLVNGAFDSSWSSLPGNLPEWARRLGPGGDLAHPSYPLRLLEIGNEQFWSYKRGSGYAAEYAPKFRDTSIAVRAANSQVKCLAMLDGNGDYSTLVNALYTVPNFHQYVDGWVFHTYGTMNGWHVPKVQQCLDLVAAKGAPNTIPIYITEDGWASDNGPELGYYDNGDFVPDNYGNDASMTYAEVGAAMRSKIPQMRALPWGSRLRVFTQYITTDGAWPGANNLREAYFGVLKIDGSAKGDITQAARDLAAQYP